MVAYGEIINLLIVSILTQHTVNPNLIYSLIH